MNSKVRQKRNYFDRRSLSWNQKELSRREREFLRRSIPGEGILPGETVLDLGGGSGRLADYLSRRFAVEVLLLDISGRMLRRGRRENCSLIQADGHCLPLPNRCLNHVLCFCAFPHFDKPEIILREARRVLRPGGNIFILHNQSRRELNQYHSQKDPEVAADLLPPLSSFRRWGVEFGLKTIRLEDKKSGFIVHYLK